MELSHLHSSLCRTCLPNTGPRVTASCSLYNKGLYNSEYQTASGGGVYFPVEVKAKVRILCPLQRGNLQPTPQRSHHKDMLGGTNEEEDYMQLLRAALELLWQLAQSLVFWQSFQQASITLPLAWEIFFFFQSCAIRNEGGPLCSKENEQALKHWVIH